MLPEQKKLERKLKGERECSQMLKRLMFRAVVGCTAPYSYVWLGSVVVRVSDLRSRGREFDSRPLHCRVAWVNSAFHPSGIGKSSTRLRTGVSPGRVHLCREAGNTV